jgi:flagellar biogenesis protein FliO
MNSVPESAIKIMKFFKARLGILEERYTQHRAKKRLRLRETVSLGDKRFIAVVEYRHQEILVAGTPNSITVLMTTSPLDGTNPPEYERLTKDHLQ